MTESPASPAWFRQHFNDDYRILYRGRDQRQADAEVAFTIDVLRIRPGSTVLDLCCGFGRHLRAFAQRGIRAIGVDLSGALLAQAPRGAGTELVCADMRRLPFPAESRGAEFVVNYFTSFGYFASDEENSQAAAEIGRVLAPGGRFLLDLMNPEPTLAGLQPRSERVEGPFTITEERRFDGGRKRMEKQIRLHDARSGAVRRYFESVRLYHPDEIRAILRQSGLTIERLHGDFSGGALTPRTPRLIVTGWK